MPIRVHAVGLRDEARCRDDVVHDLPLERRHRLELPLHPRRRHVCNGLLGQRHERGPSVSPIPGHVEHEPTPLAGLDLNREAGQLLQRLEDPAVVADEPPRHATLFRVDDRHGGTVADAFRLPPKDRRIFFLAGASAGIGALFCAPLGGALFAPEVLYKKPEFEGEAIVPCIIAPEAAATLRDRFESLFGGAFETGMQPDEWNWRPERDPPDLTRQICNGWKSDRTIARTVLAAEIGKACARLAGWPGARLAQDNLLWKPAHGRPLS